MSELIFGSYKDKILIESELDYDGDLALSVEDIDGHDITIYLNREEIEMLSAHLLKLLKREG